MLANRKEDGQNILSYVNAGEGGLPARCFVKDVLDLKDANIGDWDVWWLGTVPCRKVLLVGLVVGVMEYEKRMLYTIDDGTEVVDCIWQKLLIKQSPVKAKARSVKGKEKAAAFTAPRYASPSSSIEVGSTIQVTGKVVQWRDGKQINTETIVVCMSNDEPKHWAETTRLHRTKYSQPFTCPKGLTPVTPTRNRILNVIPMPQSSSTIASFSSAPSSPSRSSPIKPPSSAFDDTLKPLRHPAKISSSQLTTHTFRGHLVQYLDHASRPRPKTSHPSLRYHSSQEDVHPDSTPTAQRKIRRRNPSPELTPRPKQKAWASKDSRSATLMPGFSLSYLRRVPELDLLGRRVVQAEAKRRAKEARLKEKEQRKLEKLKPKPQSSKSTALSPSKRTSQIKTSTERTSLKVKRLFQMTLRTLRDDGAIIIVDGPSRPRNEHADEVIRQLCWRDLANVTSASVETAPSTLNLSTASDDPFGTIMDMDDDPPSDPDPSREEECYLPLTPYVLADTLLEAMKAIIPPGGGPMRAAGAPDIVARLKREDEKWRQLHEEHVIHTMQYLGAEEKVWKVGVNKWGLMD